MQFSSEFYLDTCSACGIPFAYPQSYFQELSESHRTFYCPNGHQQRFGESSKEREIKRLQQSALDANAKANEAQHLRLVAERAADKAKKDKRKVERRIAHGVCPCCNKTFVDLSNHMITQHKEFRLPAGKAQKQITGTVQ